MRYLATLGACLVLIPGAAVAQDKFDPMASAYGNTIVLSIGNVWTARQYVDPDHSWRQVSDDGEVRGTWSYLGDRVCMRQTAPPGPTYCHAPLERKVGDRWTNVDPDQGFTVQIELVKGRP
jgi:hypothetical protein